MQQVLAVDSLEQAEEMEREPSEDWEDRVVDAARTRGLLKNVSYFAFTATPKQKTLELFGTKLKSDEFEAFSLYSMRQAIEERFILDVLENYTTYKTYWNLLKKVKDDPHYDRKKANFLLKSFVDSHEITIEKKVKIMLEHFNSQVKKKIKNQAKAMIVTRSRLHAVRFKLAVDKFIRDQGFDFQSLVAFSGTVIDPESGHTYTESQMNTRSSGEKIPETATADAFQENKYRIMIVAEKFQTGFDQPLLHTMYVDKKLSDLHAVQTLSRLNRICPPHKKEVFVLDFVNETDEIQKAFLPYYDRTILAEATDPNLLYDYETQIKNFHILNDKKLSQFAEIYFGTKSTQDQIITELRPIVEQFKELKKDDQKRFRELLHKFIGLYSFIGQVANFIDPDLEKLYYFSRYLLKMLPIEKERLPVEIMEAIDLESLRIQQTGYVAIKLPRGSVQLKPIGELVESQPSDNELEALSKIIRDLNDRFGTEWEDNDHIPVIKQIEEGLDSSIALLNSLQINTPENARLTFDDVLEDLFQSLIETNFKFYKKINDDEELGNSFKEILYERYRNRIGLANGSSQ